MTVEPTIHPSHLIVRGLPVAEVVRGGPGSGFYGHAGRPGQQGGSAPGGGGAAGKPNGGGGSKGTPVGGPENFSMTAQIANNVQGIWSRGTSEQGGHAISTAETEVLLHIAMNAKHYDSDLVEAARDELFKRPASETRPTGSPAHVQIRNYTYHGTSGYLLSGKDPKGRGVNVFVGNRQQAEAYREALKAGDEGAMLRILTGWQAQ